MTGTYWPDKKLKMSEYIDTHMHLYDEAFDGDRDDVVDKMKKSGITHCIMPAIDISASKAQMRCSELYGSYTSLALGLHPTSVCDTWKEELDFVVSQMKHSSMEHVCAVGEIGLDEYWSKEFSEQQKIVFMEQIKLAEEADLPMIIHLRNATESLFEVLDKMKGCRMRGVFHAYSGSYEMYERINRYGNFIIGIGGVVTFKNAQVAKTLESVPLDRIVFETDSPYLSPVPFRGKRNDSSNIPYISHKVAEIKMQDEDMIAKKVMETTKNWFNI